MGAIEERDRGLIDLDVKTRVQALVDPEKASIDPSPSSRGPRYQTEKELGKGGMGVVRLCHDARIGRAVALKVVRPESQDNQDLCARFLREARVQGQLEHPGIVPVYDVGIDETGSMFFTMKCLHGMTLAQIIRGLRSGDDAISAACSRRKLLTAFSSLCLSVDYAHSRGVLHRDIKPSNVMLGDFGEVYLLDWGIAKILDAPVKTIDMRGALSGHATAAGELLGTPGYIAPEQAWGQTDRLDARTDVYALGAILFEVLAWTPLHARGDVLKVLRSTTEGADARPSVRAPEREIPPELDEICVKATAREKHKRYTSARALHEAIERFLDGNRNVELRRDLATEHAARAEAAVLAALSAPSYAAEKERRVALREVGRALALDPTNERTLSAMHKVFTAQPHTVPAEVTTELEAAENDRHKVQLREGVVADFLGLGFSLPIGLWIGLRDASIYGVMAALTLVSTGFKILAYRGGGGANVGRLAYLAFVFNALAVLCFSRAWGPLFVMPLLLVMFAHGYASAPWPRYRRRIVATAVGVQLVAVLLEAAALWPPSYHFADGAMIVLPRALSLSRWPTLAGLTAFSLFMLVVPSRIAGRVQDVLRSAEVRALTQSWQLRQLVPQGARESLPESARKPAGRGAG